MVGKSGSEDTRETCVWNVRGNFKKVRKKKKPVKVKAVKTDS